MSKTLKTILIALSSVVVLALSFVIGYTLGTGTRPGSGQEMASVQQVWDLLAEGYVNQEKLDAAILSQAAINGMLEALDDPYTAFLDEETYKLGLSTIAGKFDGIGAQVGIRDEQLMIIAPLPDSPAARAGIRSGDTILEIDGQSTQGMSLTEAVLRVRGQRGTSVRLLILRPDQPEPETIEIVRAEIELTSVNFEMRADIAYIRLTQFSERTAAELAPVLKTIGREGATGIIIDLRGNPGGLLEAVIDVTSYFLAEGVVVSVVDGKGQETVWAVEPQGITTDLPLVVLVDGFSASASEVMAGALQDSGRAITAGTITFGKGSVQVLLQLEDGSGLAITTARWFTPQGRLIEGKGLIPDYELELEGDDAIDWAIEYLRKNQP